jgi:hypothetical protein
VENIKIDLGEIRWCVDWIELAGRGTSGER